MAHSGAVPRRRRWIWLIVAGVVVVAAAGAAFVLRWVLPSRPPSEVTATALAAEYYADPALATARYGNRTLTVSGTPYFVGNTRLGKYIDSDEGAIAIPCVALSVGLEGEAEFAQRAAAGFPPFYDLPGVVGVLPPDAPPLAGAAQAGQPIRLRGLCKGMSVGRAIILDECQIVP
jgi:hypothetical protein